MNAIVSLFAGAGGLSSGFAEAGFKPAVAVEIDRDACNTYKANIGVQPLQMDVSSKETLDAIVSKLEGQAVAAVIGGPPCQGFSTAGGRYADDPRNRLIFSYFAIVDALKPRWFLFENVEGLLTSGGGEAIITLVRSFIDRGYSVRLEKVNFASFGLPQARKRVILVGNRLGCDFAFPQATHSFNAGKHRSYAALPASPSLDVALAGLGNATNIASLRTAYSSETPVTAYDEFMRSGMTEVSMHFSSVSDADVNRYQCLRQGQSMKDMPEHLWHPSFKRRAYRRVVDGTPTEKRGGAPSGLKRLNGEFNSLTITGAATQEFIHPTLDRPITLREAARLQSFKDNYEFCGNTVSKARQIGNAFPPLCAKIFAQHIMNLDAQLWRNDQFFNFVPPCLIDFTLTDSVGMSPALRATFESLTDIRDHTLDFVMAAE